MQAGKARSRQLEIGQGLAHVAWLQKKATPPVRRSRFGKCSLPRSSKAADRDESCLGLSFFDVLDDVVHADKLFGLFVRHFDIELFLDRHD